MADNDLPTLLKTLTKIYQETGGRDEANKPANRKGKGDRFPDIKAEAINRIKNIKMISQELLDNQSMGGSSKPKPSEIISLRQSRIKEMNALQADIGDLKREYQKASTQKRGKSKFSQQELEYRLNVIKQLEAQFRLLDGSSRDHGGPGLQSIKDFKDIANEGAAGPGASMRGATRGGGGPGRVAEVEMTDAQRQGLQLIEGKETQIDSMLDQMGEGLDVLHELATNLGDEFDKHNMILDDIDGALGRAQGKMDTVNQSMKETLEKVTGGGDRFCMHLICFILLLGVLTVVYNQIKNKDS